MSYSSVHWILVQHTFLVVSDKRPPELFQGPVFSTWELKDVGFASDSPRMSWYWRRRVTFPAIQRRDGWVAVSVTNNSVTA